jgi:CO dehydrogenase nickel-insertion accessory protein CooC1
VAICGSGGMGKMALAAEVMSYFNRKILSHGGSESTFIFTTTD